MIVRHPINGDAVASPSHVSDFLLIDSRDRGDVLTNLKLQKLLYYAQAWYLALYGAPIFEEDFEAWVHGPVLPSQYHRFKEHEWRPIQGKIHMPGAFPRALNNHLQKITTTFGTETATALEMMTHQEAPWLRARRGLASTTSSNAKISKDIMKEFYRGM